jgi:hypothetical protein
VLTAKPRSTASAGPVAAVCAVLLACVGFLLVWVPAWGQDGRITLSDVQIDRNDEGLWISFGARIELPRAVEEALIKGVPLNFEAEVRTFRSRWYWRDLEVAAATLSWRVTYQPLTRRYRVQSGAFSQQFESLHEALGTMQRTESWKVAHRSRLAAGERHYAELVFRLDTSQLPRPFQFGIGGQAQWDLSAQSILVIPDQP